jgi:hypothetical protein
VFFIGVVLMKSVKAFGTTGPEFCGTAMNTFGHDNSYIGGGIAAFKSNSNAKRY